MFRGFFGAFRDRQIRPRALIWTSVVLVGLVMVSAFAILGTSTNWFCTEPCHTIHLDNTKTFNAGSHQMVSCVACHEPVNGSPLTFLLMKIEVLPDLIPSIAARSNCP
jgi:hypothetical protein